MSRKASQRVNPPNNSSIVLIAIAAALGISLFGVEPQGVEAGPITCPISATSTLPTQSQFHDLVAAEPDYEGDSAQFNGARSGVWQVWAPVSSRCQKLLGKGVYRYRMIWSVELQLTNGWPIGRDYSESPDVSSNDVVLFEGRGARFYAESLTNGFMNIYEESGPLGTYEGLGDSSYIGSDGEFIPLTELCFSERCRFDRETTGVYSSVTGTSIPYIAAFIDMCFPYSPVGEEGLAETELCTAFGADQYAHPGAFGMRVQITGTMIFDPEWTWRR